jgi:hypothetical protein
MQRGMERAREVLGNGRVDVENNNDISKTQDYSPPRGCRRQKVASAKSLKLTIRSEERITTEGDTKGKNSKRTEKFRNSYGHQVVER